MLEEAIFKIQFIGTLNRQHEGWVDGDKERSTTKKADIVNRELAIAIEIKDDDQYKIPRSGMVQTTDLTRMNERFSDHIRSANNKFKNYPNFKTVVLFRTEYIPQTVRYAIEGLDQYKRVNGSLSYAGKVGKYSKYGKNDVGGYLIFAHDVYYFENWLAKEERIIKKTDLEKLLGQSLKDLM